MASDGYETPEQAVLAGGGWPAGMATVVGLRVSGNEARVWLLTNDRPSFEKYECVCFRENGRWHEVHGSGGFSIVTPREVRKAAAAIEARFNR
jgi:hypothetical protein